MTQTKTNNSKNIRWYMRYLHNKIGFFIVGLVIIYSFSGIIQTYRDTDLLKQVINHEKTLTPNLNEAQLGASLKIKNLKVEKTENNILYFKDGTYDAGTGIAKFTTKEWYSWIRKVTELHKSNSKSIAHYFTVAFSVLLFFMSISAFWMFKPGTKLFSGGVWMTIAGIVASVLLLLIS
jgi:hypothetical protein